MDKRLEKWTDFDKEVKHRNAQDERTRGANSPREPIRHELRIEPQVSEPSVDSVSDPDAPEVRQGEEPKTWFRGSRYYQLDSDWFFSTREGIDLGPYLTKSDAEQEVKLLVKMLAETDPSAAVLLIQEFKNRPSCGGGAKT